MKQALISITLMSLILASCLVTPKTIPAAAETTSTSNSFTPTSSSTTQFDTITATPATTTTAIPTDEPTEEPTATPMTLDQWAKTIHPDKALIEQVLSDYARTMGLPVENILLDVEFLDGVDGQFAVIVDKANDLPFFVSVKDTEGLYAWMPATLRGIGEKMEKKLGVEGLGGGNDKERFQVMAEQFNQMTITALSWSRSQPDENQVVLEIPQAYLEKALTNGQTPTFQHLVYGNSTDLPDWLKNGNYSREDAIGIMHNHITTVMRSNKALYERLKRQGRVNGVEKLQYIVVNEGVNEPGYYWPVKIGPEYIEIAFQTARAADPDAVLIYNDFGHELPTGQNLNGVFDVVFNLKSGGLIDGVGMQMHFLGGPDNLDPNIPIQDLENGIREQIDLYAQIGVPVYITELDVDLSKISGSSEVQRQKAAEIYRMIYRICGSTKNCVELSVFGLNSDSSWIFDLGGEGILLFSDNKPLPTYYAALTGLYEGIKTTQH